MTTIKIIENGPALIEDPEGIDVMSFDKKEKEFPSRIALCRCGKSGNQPYCDGSHKPKITTHEPTSSN